MYFVQGDSADCMYFVEDGEVRITMTQKVSSMNSFLINLYIA